MKLADKIMDMLNEKKKFDYVTFVKDMELKKADERNLLRYLDDIADEMEVSKEDIDKGMKLLKIKMV